MRYRLGRGHLHEFRFGHACYGAVEPSDDLLEGVMQEEHVSLYKALGRHRSFVYLYDYGADWEHKVKVEAIVTLDAPIEFAVCIAGANACPPEDVGDAAGYEEFLKALPDPNHAEHEMLTEWIGGAFDPTAFNLAEINKRLLNQGPLQFVRSLCDRRRSPTHEACHPKSQMFLRPAK